MKQEQTKTLLVNIFTGVVVIGVFVAGYIVFIKKDSTESGVKTVSRIAEQTSTVGAEIDNTMKDLRELSDAVARSNVFFGLPEFTNLENFSVKVPSEKIGRKNPFLPTPWKIKIKDLETTSGDNVPAQTSTQSASVLNAQPEVPAGLLGDFDIED